MPLILGTNSIKDPGGYNVANSLRFNSGDSPSMSKASSDTGNAQFSIFSCWVKRGSLGSNQTIFGHHVDANNTTQFGFDSDDKLIFHVEEGGSDIVSLISNAVFRDTSAFYHLMLVQQQNASAAADRIKIMANGSRLTLATSTIPNELSSNHWVAGGDGTYSPRIGFNDGADNNYFNGYLTEVVFLDGQTIPNSNDADYTANANSTVEYDEDSGILKPKDPSALTFGTNGFYFEFKQTGTSQNSSGLGADTSGNDSHFAVSNLAAVDQSTDTCTNNHMTWNPLYVSAGGTYTGTEGNLHVRGSDSHNTRVGATFAAQKGKWYWEVKQLGSVTNGGSWAGAFEVDEVDINGSTAFFGNQTKAMGVRAGSSTVLPRGNGQGDGTTLGDIAVNGILMFAMDIDNGFLYVGLNGTFLNSGDPSTGASGTGNINNGAAGGVTYNWDFEGKLVMPGINIQNADFFETNFGSPSFAISSGNTDANGHGNFEYAVPSGYFTWNTKNLAEFG